VAPQARRGHEECIAGAMPRCIARADLAVAIAAPAIFACGLVAGFELGYWRLRPPALREPPPLPPLARAALRAECGATEGEELPVLFPFLEPQIAALFIGELLGPTSQRDRPHSDLLSRLAKTQMFALGEGTLPKRLSHPSFAARELATATWISRHWSSTQAIDAYGALVYVGHGRRGLRRGAEYYFGRPLESLGVAETALLVAITGQPTRLDPACFPERAAVARNRVLTQMFFAGVLDGGAAARAAAAPVVAAGECNRLTGVPRTGRSRSGKTTAGARRTRRMAASLRHPVALELD